MLVVSSKDGGDVVLNGFSEKSSDGKSFVNPPTNVLSKAYDSFAQPISNGERGGFDVHIYFFQVRKLPPQQEPILKIPQNNADQAKFALELWERIRREFPELRIYRVWDRPVGPHPIAMFEVNLFTPKQFGAFIPWLVINRGPLSALVHPNTDDEERDHTQRATWMGERLPLDLSMFKSLRQARAKLETVKAEKEDVN